MSENSKIEWTDHTFNPWIGCTKVSPGCAHCYAAAQDKFRNWTPEGWGQGKPRKRTSIANWREPVKWNAAAAAFPWKCPACKCAITDHSYESDPSFNCSNCGKAPLVPNRPRVFSASLADWLDDDGVPIEWLADFLQLIHATPHLDWLLLTKRPENWLPRIEAVFQLLNTDRAAYELRPGAAELVGRWFGEPPYQQAPANVWIGTTVEDQARADLRIPALLAIPAKVRFLSCEPLLGPVDLSRVVVGEERIDYDPLRGKELPGAVCRDRIHWVICGGESGGQARPMHPEWARSLRDQCAAAGVPFFFKQWGEWGWSESLLATGAAPYLFVEPNGKTDRDDGTLASAMMYRVGKKAAGHLLDGIEHHAFPR